MKRKIWIIVLAVVLLLAVIITVLCCSNWVKLRWEICGYQSAIEELPEDLTLTIYYMPHTILTRAPLTVDRLINNDSTVKIVVTANELAKHVDALKRLDASDLQPASGEYWLNARFHYVFARGDQKILEVTRECYGKSDEMTADYALINGILVEEEAVLYEIVIPFMSEEDIENSGLIYLDLLSAADQDIGPNGEIPFAAD